MGKSNCNVQKCWHICSKHLRSTFYVRLRLNDKLCIECSDYATIFLHLFAHPLFLLLNVIQMVFEQATMQISGLMTNELVIWWRFFVLCCGCSTSTENVKIQLFVKVRLLNRIYTAFLTWVNANKNCRFASSFWRISRLRSSFAMIQTCVYLYLSKYSPERHQSWFYQQIFNRKSI